jgi:hypothetical protein
MQRHLGSFDFILDTVSAVHDLNAYLDLLQPPVLVDVCFARVLDIARRGTGEHVTPTRVELRGSPGQREMYEAHFACPAKFDARQNTLVFATADVERPSSPTIRTSSRPSSAAPPADSGIRRHSGWAPGSTASRCLRSAWAAWA